MTTDFDFTLAALVGLRTSQKQAFAAIDRLQAAMKADDEKAMKDAKQDFADWHVIVEIAEKTADYAIERALKREAA